MNGINESVVSAVKVGRKHNAAADPAQFKRFELTRLECRRRRVNFLPLQVMRPLFKKAGI